MGVGLPLHGRFRGSVPLWSTMKENTKDNATDWEKINEEIFYPVEQILPIQCKIPERYIEAKPRRRYTEEELLALAELIRRT